MSPVGRGWHPLLVTAWWWSLTDVDGGVPSCPRWDCEVDTSLTLPDVVITEMGKKGLVMVNGHVQLCIQLCEQIQPRTGFNPVLHCTDAVWWSISRIVESRILNDFWIIFWKNTSRQVYVRLITKRGLYSICRRKVTPVFSSSIFELPSINPGTDALVFPQVLQVDLTGGTCPNQWTV